MESGDRNFDRKTAESQAQTWEPFIRISSENCRAEFGRNIRSKRPVNIGKNYSKSHQDPWTQYCGYWLKALRGCGLAGWERREGLQVITSDLWVLPKASWSIFRASPPGNQGWLVSPRLRTLFLSKLPIPLLLIV